MSVRPIGTPSISAPSSTPVGPARSSPDASVSPTDASDRFQGAAPVQSASLKTGPLSLESDEGRGAVEAAYQGLANRARSTGLGLVGPSNVRADYAPQQAFRDELGQTHVRMDRYSQGLPVFGDQVIVHLDAEGKLSGVTDNGPVVPAGLDVRPGITAEQAVDTVARDFGSTPQSPLTARLGVYGGVDGSFRPAYQVQARNLADPRGPRNMQYFVDAQSGTILTKYNTIDSFVGPVGSVQLAAGTTDSTRRQPSPSPSPAPGPSARNGLTDDTTLYYGKVALNGTQNPNGTWRLEDDSRGQGILTRDAGDRPDASRAVDFTDDDNVWGETTDSPRQRGAIDAEYAAQETYDFYKDTFGRDSIDGQGERLLSNVHVTDPGGGPMVNAYWDGTQMNYGDGDGTTAGPLTSLDIGGHEISHGLTERTANLTYAGESGGLNEAMSDIFGKGVEWFASQTNPSVQFGWGVGAAVWTPNTPGDALRYMDDPTKDGYSIDNLSQISKFPQNVPPTDQNDQNGVHGTSGIANNAFVLMVQGGTNRTSGMTVDPSTGLGMGKALKIMYRAETTYYTPSTDFRQAAQAAVKAATDLYGSDSPEVKTTTAAWTAVGCLPAQPPGRS